MNGKRLVERASALSEARSFFDSRGYIEVETPLLVPSPALDVHLDAFAVEERYLSTSPEYQMKRLLGAGAKRIFQISKAFRRNERGTRHNPEFTILEFYRAHASVHAIMRDTEQLVAKITKGEVVIDNQTFDLKPPFDRITVCDAFERYAGWPREKTLHAATHDEDSFYLTLVDTVEPRLREHPRAIFVTDYPIAQASLARKNPTDPEVAERFELYVAGVELCNGFGELVDPGEQHARLVRDQDERKARGLPVYPIDHAFLNALRSGLPECAGNAIGFDRLVAIANHTADIRATISFMDDEL